ncbi:serine/threonine-protein kinase, partial [Pseudonocardia lacus]|uniref:serine/threonine-protein kinase n=1 Tax=Pseudonocardia lacus TaxID=2835865 RepID=UPI001BDBB272
MTEPELFGPYRLDTVIGRGGMGEVFRAFDTRRNRVVAVKRMSKHLVTDPEYRKRFRRESALAAMLREPHIIPIHDYGEIDGQLYIDMRLVEGTDLAGVLKRVQLSVERAVDVVSQIADALDAAHAEGLVHRDVKPSNALLVGTSPEEAASRGFVYLVDFGVAATLGGTTLSRPGLAVGSAAYMAPERMMGDDWDSRADVYSLACLLYETLTGRRPYPSDDLLTLLQAHMKAPPPRASDVRRDLPPGMDQVVATGMAKLPNARFSSAGELADAARAVLERAPAPPRNPDDVATVVRRRPTPRPGPARGPATPPAPAGP